MKTRQSSRNLNCPLKFQTLTLLISPKRDEEMKKQAWRFCWWSTTHNSYKSTRTNKRAQIRERKREPDREAPKFHMLTSLISHPGTTNLGHPWRFVFARERWGKETRLSAKWNAPREYSLRRICYDYLKSSLLEVKTQVRLVISSSIETNLKKRLHFRLW